MTRTGSAGWRALLSAALLAVVAVAVANTMARGQAEGTAGTAGLLSQAGGIGRRVSQLRRLPFKRPVERGVLSRAEIRARVIAQLDREYGDARIATESRVLQRLGLLPAGADYKQLFVEVVSEQIAGFYDPWERRLYIADWVRFDGELDEGRMVVAHETAHALQDQHFELKKFVFDAVSDNDDAAAARSALVEGDAMAVMFEYMFADGGSAPPWGDPRTMALLYQTMVLGRGGVASAVPGTDRLAQAPLVMQARMTFPYASGLRFIAHFRRYHPWKRIDELYGKPPLSTEHILHPKAYERYDRPEQVIAGRHELLPAPVSTMKLVYQNTTGELGWQILLRQHGLSERQAGRAAEGWGGDRLTAYAPAGSTDPASLVVVSYSVWDQEVDAVEFADALSAVAGRSRLGLVERRGAAVLWLVGGGAQAAEIVPLVWRHWRTKRGS